MRQILLSESARRCPIDSHTTIIHNEQAPCRLWSWIVDDSITLTKNAEPYLEQLGTVLAIADLDIYAQPEAARLSALAILDDINTLSGSWAFDFLLGSVGDAGHKQRLKGNVGAALAYRWMKRLEQPHLPEGTLALVLSLEGLLRATPAAQLPLQDGLVQRHGGRRGERYCDDLLVLYLCPNASANDAPWRFVGRIIEVKFGTAASNSVPKGLEQVRSTQRLLQTHLSGDATQVDAPFRHRQLSLLIKGQLEQALALGVYSYDQVAALDPVRMSAAIASGRYRVDYAYVAEGVSLTGDVFILSTDPNAGGEVGQPQIAVKEKVRVITLGRQSVEWLAFENDLGGPTLLRPPRSTLPDLAVVVSAKQPRRRRARQTLQDPLPASPATDGVAPQAEAMPPLAHPVAQSPAAMDAFIQPPPVVDFAPVEVDIELGDWDDDDAPAVLDVWMGGPEATDPSGADTPSDPVFTHGFIPPEAPPSPDVALPSTTEGLAWTSLGALAPAGGSQEGGPELDPCDLEALEDDAASGPDAASFAARQKTDVDHVVLARESQPLPLAKAVEIPFAWAQPDLERLHDAMAHLRNALLAHRVRMAEELTAADIEVGPRLVRVHLRLESGESIDKVRRVSEDIAREVGIVGASDIHICNVPSRRAIAMDLPLPGLGYAVDFASVQAHPSFAAAQRELTLPICAGVEVSGRLVWTDLAKMPHMLVAGTSGSGKTVFLRTMILTLILHHRPEWLRLRLASSKPMDFNPFTQVPHLDGELVGDPEAISVLVAELTEEMDQRIAVISAAGFDDLAAYNRAMPTPIPFKVIVIDEFAETVLSFPERAKRTAFEAGIARLAQKARAAGIHLVLSMQRPDSNVIQGAIKANMLHRFALKLPQAQDSRVILDERGAETLLGQGDLLYKNDMAELFRLQVPFLSSERLRESLN